MDVRSKEAPILLAPIESFFVNLDKLCKCSVHLASSFFLDAVPIQIGVLRSLRGNKGVGVVTLNCECR